MESRIGNRDLTITFEIGAIAVATESGRPPVPAGWVRVQSQGFAWFIDSGAIDSREPAGNLGPFLFWQINRPAVFQPTFDRGPALRPRIKFHGPPN